MCASSSMRCEYDAAGRRVFRAADVDRDGTFDEQLRYLYEGIRVVEERDAALVGQPLLRETVYGTTYIDEPIWQQVGGGTEYLVAQDENFNVYALWEVMGGGALQIAQQVRYDAYGTHQLYDAAGDLLGDENASSAITSLLYQGQRFDAESGTCGLPHIGLYSIRWRGAWTIDSPQSRASPVASSRPRRRQSPVRCRCAQSRRLARHGSVLLRRRSACQSDHSPRPRP